MQRIGIVTGVADELAAFLPDTPRKPSHPGPPGIAYVIHAGIEVHLLCAGIGKVAAATAAGLLHARCGAELLVVIGTAGKIAPIDGDLFWIEAAIQADYGAQRADGLTHYTAGEWPIGPAALSAFAPLPLADPGLPRARIATSDLFIECGVHAARLRDRLDVALVDMETAAVAQTATLLGVPWLAVKATTDGADGTSAAAFAANLAVAARASAAAAERIIATLAGQPSSTIPSRQAPKLRP